MGTGDVSWGVKAAYEWQSYYLNMLIFFKVWSPYLPEPSGLVEVCKAFLTYMEICRENTYLVKDGQKYRIFYVKT